MDFSKQTVKKLTRQGITLTGRSQAIPQGNMSYGIGYQLIYDGCSYLRSFSQVLAIADGRASITETNLPYYMPDHCRVTYSN